MSNFTITDLLGLFGNLFAIVFFLIPIWMIINLIKTKKIETIPWLLFIFTILNCEFWLIYGLKLKAWPVYVCNGFGITTNFFYLITFYLFLNKSILIKVIYIVISFSSFILIFAVFYYFITNIQLIGAIACTVNILMFATPLQKIREVYEKKDNSFIPIHVSFSLVVNCFIWILYGCFKEMDYFIIIPNFLGLLLSCFQIYLWFLFRDTTPIFQQIKSDSNSGEELKTESNNEVKIDLNKNQ
jgi:solute carrier family 50 protein (sugar transporter)